MTLMINDRQNLYETGEIEKLIESVVGKTIEHRGITDNCQISVVLVDNKQIRKMNKTYRGIDSSTDVLSFPMLEYDDDNYFHGDGTAEHMDIDTGELVLGDIVISLEKAYVQSGEYGHSMEREVAFLTVHGMLHLLGYDHETDDERTLMRREEEEILGILNIKR